MIYELFFMCVGLLTGLLALYYLKATSRAAPREQSFKVDPLSPHLKVVLPHPPFLPSLSSTSTCSYSTRRTVRVCPCDIPSSSSSVMAPRGGRSFTLVLSNSCGEHSECQVGRGAYPQDAHWQHAWEDSWRPRE